MQSRIIGFSTGALARSDFHRALATLRHHQVNAVELSALRLAELGPLCEAIPNLDLSDFAFVSIHAPSKFNEEEEAEVIRYMAGSSAATGYPVVVHPDVIYHCDRWATFGDRLLIENMDKRKPIGRTVEELASLFHEQLPAARFCFDIGHARQIDPSMTEAALLLRAFGDRLAEVHMSEVNTASRHDPISRYAVQAFSRVASMIPPHVPIILESLIDEGQSDIATEVARAKEVFALAEAVAA